MVGWFLKLSVVVILAYGGMLLLTGWQFATAPVGFVPQQDKGYLILTVQLQDAASLERTDKVMARLDQVIRGQTDGGALQRGVWKTLAVSGQSLITNASAPNLGSMYILLKNFPDRPGLSADEVRAELLERCQKEVPEALMAAFGGPPIDGLGTTGGFKLIIENRGNLGPEELDKVTSNIIDEGNNSGLAPRPVLHLAGGYALAESRISTAPNAWPWASRSRTSSTRSRSTSAPTMSTTSTSSGGPGR